jgi:lipopolysaccharide export system ATP-binding protein
MAILEVKNLFKVYDKKNAVNDVNFSIEKGEVIGLLGPNGAGKTSTFNMIVGLIPPDRGSIRLDGKDITDFPMYKRARMGIGYLPQEPSVFRGLTVEENILAILETLHLSNKEQDERLSFLLNELRISHLAGQTAYTLSGGERRRVEIARALVTSPAFMLLDEPFAGIDPISVSDVQDIIQDLKKKGIGILITDHNVRETLRITDRSYIIFEGKVLLSGTASELAANEQVRKVFLGDKFTL